MKPAIIDRQYFLLVAYFVSRLSTSHDPFSSLHQHVLAIVILNRTENPAYWIGCITYG